MFWSHQVTLGSFPRARCSGLAVAVSVLLPLRADCQQRGPFSVFGPFPPGVIDQECVDRVNGITLGDAKNTFCALGGEFAFIGPHGDSTKKDFCSRLFGGTDLGVKDHQWCVLHGAAAILGPYHDAELGKECITRLSGTVVAGAPEGNYCVVRGTHRAVLGPFASAVTAQQCKKLVNGEDLGEQKDRYCLLPEDVPAYIIGPHDSDVISQECTEKLGGVAFGGKHFKYCVLTGEFAIIGPYASTSVDSECVHKFHGVVIGGQQKKRYCVLQVPATIIGPLWSTVTGVACEDLGGTLVGSLSKANNLRYCVIPQHNDSMDESAADTGHVVADGKGSSAFSKDTAIVLLFLLAFIGGSFTAWHFRESLPCLRRARASKALEKDALYPMTPKTPRASQALVAPPGQPSGYANQMVEMGRR